MTDLAAAAPGPLFHRTSRPLEPGTVLLPGAVVGRDNYLDLYAGHSDRVFVTTSLEAAVHYGLNAVGEDTHPAADLYVHEVRVDGPLSTQGRIGLEDFACAAAVVEREVDHAELYAAHRIRVAA